MSVSVLHRVRHLFAPDRDIYRECRECGATLDADQSVCPCCDSTAIARYDLS